MAERPLESDPLVDQLLPEDEVPPTDEEEFEDFSDDDLFDPEPIVIEEDDVSPIGRSWAFDFSTGDFLPRPGGGPQETHGLRTLRYWVEKCLRTPRGAYPIYGPDYGIDGVDDLIGGPVDDDIVADLGEKVRTALLFHPHVTDVTDYEFATDPDDDLVEINFTVVTDQNDELDFSGFDLELSA